MKKLRTTGSVTPIDRLCVALNCGVMEMLSGADVLRVLRTSGVVRSDAGATGSALRTVAADPRWLWLDTQRLAHTAELSATAVQLAWRIQAFLTHELETEAVGKVTLRPFLVLLVAADGSTSDVPISLAQLTRPTATMPSTVFGSHWEHIAQQSDNGMENDDLVCALCEAGVTSVCQYREETDAFTSAFEDQLTQRETEWEAQGESPRDVLEKSFAFQQAYFRNEPFYNAYVANQDDTAVLQYIYERGRFPIALSGGLIADALSVAAREICRCAYRPVKQLLSAICLCPLMRGTLTAETPSAEAVAGACGRLLVGFCVASPV